MSAIIFWLINLYSLLIFPIMQCCPLFITVCNLMSSYTYQYSFSLIMSFVSTSRMVIYHTVLSWYYHSKNLKYFILTFTNKHNTDYLFLGITRIEPFNERDVLDTFFFSKINIKKYSKEKKMLPTTWPTTFCKKKFSCRMAICINIYESQVHTSEACKVCL